MVSANNAIYNTVGASISGVTNTLTVTNPSNTASSAARETITVGGGTAADPTINWNVNAVTDWEMGIDNSDSDKWKLSQGTVLGTNDTIVAFTGGQVLKPRQPAFLAYVTANQVNVTGDGTIYPVIFDTETQDIGSNYNNATGVFTAPVTGTYIFTGVINYFGITAAMNSQNIDLAYNLGQFSALKYHGNNAGATQIADINNAFSSTVTGIIPMTAGDTMQVTAQISGGTKTALIIGSTSFPGLRVSFFSGFLLG